LTREAACKTKETVAPGSALAGVKAMG